MKVLIYYVTLTKKINGTGNRLTDPKTTAFLLIDAAACLFGTRAFASTACCAAFIPGEEGAARSVCPASGVKNKINVY